MLPIQNADELIKKAVNENLHLNLIKQLNKDFQLANLNEGFNLSINPIQLKEALYKKVLNLIINKYDDYLSFLYRIDVPEKELLAITSDNLETVTKQITFLILKREYQKVWFRSKF
jgi:hypothetical protein